MEETKEIQQMQDVGMERLQDVEDGDRKTAGNAGTEMREPKFINYCYPQSRTNCPRSNMIVIACNAFLIIPE
jgi:hypothetical protein